ncbi:unnamed protein product [Caenorhabditis brenneri]
MTSTTEIVKLNIGGALFQTTKSTLTRFDGFFRTILETDVPVTKDETGAFFIDRDPTYFRLILNFMRDGHVELPTCIKEIKKISKEAQYYLLTGLVELCSRHSQTEPNNEIFKMFYSEDEESLAVLNSKKPVLVIYTIDCVGDFVNRRGYNKWTQFIEQHSPKWKIYFRRAKEDKWCIHYDRKRFFECSPEHRNETYSCGHPRFHNPSKSYFIHLEYHMNRCLTHPENTYLKYEEYLLYIDKIRRIFKTILETDVPVTKDETGAFFIDRDPTHFRLILNFMRDGNVKLPGCKDSIEEISKEAQYYLLTGLVELCSKQSEICSNHSQPNNELFKVLDSADEEGLAVLNSKKPVLIIYAGGLIFDYVKKCGYEKWKQFIEKHSPKWNIFFSKSSGFWCIHYNGEKFLECSVDYRTEAYYCGHPGVDTLSHLEYHMNRCLTHPENMNLKYKEYSDFLQQ